MDEKRENLTDEEVVASETDNEQISAEETEATPEANGEAYASATSDSAAQPENPRKKSQLWGNIFFVVSIALSLYLIYGLSRKAGSGSEKTFIEVFSNLNVKYLLISLATVVGMMGLDSLKYFVIMRATKVGANYRTALTVGMLGKYYDYITPFSSGGQPMQIYYLHKKGIGGGESSAVIFIKFAFNMTMWLAICLCLMVFNRGALYQYVTDSTQLKLFQVAGWIGFAVNCALPLLILSCVVFPKMTLAITRWVLNIGYKLKIVKDKDAQLERGKKAVSDFVAAFVSMIKRPLHSIILAVLCIVEPLLGMMLPYFVVVALGGAAVTPSFDLMLAIMTLNVYVQMSVTVVPTPGNSGAMESAFMMTLVSVSEGVLFWTVFSWRFLSYYSYIIIGLGITIAHLIKNNRKTRLQPPPKADASSKE